MVDAGATDSLVPRPYLEEIGLAPKGRRSYELTDGSKMEMETTTADVEIMGEVVGTTIVYGEDGIEPLLGATVLESAGIAIDPRSQSL